MRIPTEKIDRSSGDVSNTNDTCACAGAYACRCARVNVCVCACVRVRWCVCISVHVRKSYKTRMRIACHTNASTRNYVTSHCALGVNIGVKLVQDVTTRREHIY